MAGLAAMALVLMTAGGAAWAAEPAGNPGSAMDAPTPDSAPRSEGTSEPAPVRSYTDAQGRSCRVYTRTVLIDGAARTALATVCREPNGRWVLSR
jgi:hypothetical protein